MTEEQAALLRRARSDLGIARLTSREPTAYAAASRAYYAMFSATRALLLGEGLDYSKHSAVIAAFGKEFAKTGRVPSEMHRYLIRAHEARLAADYNTLAVVTVEEAEEQIARAEEFVNLAEQLLSPTLDPAQETT